MDIALVSTYVFAIVAHKSAHGFQFTFTDPRNASNIINGTAFGTTRAGFWPRETALSQLDRRKVRWDLHTCSFCFFLFFCFSLLFALFLFRVRQIGDSLAVFYDPDHPSVLTFERGFDSCAVFQLSMISVFGGLLAAGGIVLLVLGCCSWRAEVQYRQLATQDPDDDDARHY